MTLQPGHRLGRYEILEAIGAGGMGEVYRARDTSLERDIAIKILPDAFSNDPERLSRFEREAKAVSSLNHPHICTLHDIGNDDGIRYMVMELIEGETLQSRLARKPLSFEEALEYAIQIADALACAHAAGVVHRDLKPGNVMITKSGIKLLDFGLAKVQREDSGASVDSETPTQQKDLTSQGAVLGTFRYMSPEQLEGREIDARTDIFAFGAVLYEMVTGKKAFDGASEASLIVAIMDSEPDSITTSKALDWIVRTAIAKEPDDRWSSMHDVKLHLQRLSIVDDPEATRPSPRSSVLAWGVAAVAAMALVVSL
ncbi:MAG: serine/threonine-protein kinase, partial [bacterium]|nr:serine/threonine-protein kinase [bacterium]